MKTAFHFVFYAFIGCINAQQLCDSADFCAGLSVLSVDGRSQPLFKICDDGDMSTDSTCQDLRCTHTAKENTAVCFTDCVPDCEGKLCGEDDCGGFCGLCGEGEGCANFECVQGMAAGSCASPIHLGNLQGPTLIDTDTRVTIVTTGDTLQSLHMETPLCNTLTASPELIHRFEVAIGRTYG
jgi:hypothetical protein